LGGRKSSGRCRGLGRGSSRRRRFGWRRLGRGRGSRLGAAAGNAGRQAIDRLEIIRSRTLDATITFRTIEPIRYIAVPNPVMAAAAGISCLVAIKRMAKADFRKTAGFGKIRAAGFVKVDHVKAAARLVDAEMTGYIRVARIVADIVGAAAAEVHIASLFPFQMIALPGFAFATVWIAAARIIAMAGFVCLRSSDAEREVIFRHVENQRQGNNNDR